MLSGLLLFHLLIRISTEEQRDCIICVDTFPKSETLRLKCNCIWCFGCLERVFTLATEDKANMPSKCCEEINPGHYGSSLRKRLPRSLVKLYNLKRQEFALKRPVYCPAKDCGEWIQPHMVQRDAATGRAVGTCPKCRKRVCYKCRDKFHGAKPCDKKGEEAMNDLIRKNQNFQRCYRCSTVVERAFGCSHMTCRCGAEFCIGCGEQWNWGIGGCNRCRMSWVPPPDPEAAAREVQRDELAAAAAAPARPAGNGGRNDPIFMGFNLPVRGMPPPPPPPPPMFVPAFPVRGRPIVAPVRLPGRRWGGWPPPPPPPRMRENDLNYLMRALG